MNISQLITILSTEKLNHPNFEQSLPDGAKNAGALLRAALLKFYGGDSLPLRISPNRVLEIASEVLTRKQATLVARTPPYVREGSDEETIFHNVVNKLRTVCGIHNLVRCSHCDVMIHIRKKVDTSRSYNCSIECRGQSDSVKSKIVTTCQKKYGCSNGGASKQAREKIERTNLERFGVTSWAKLPESRKFLSEKAKAEYFRPDILEKRTRTNQERYGGDNPMSSDAVKRRVRATHRKKYGKYYLKTEEFKKKQKESFLRKSGGVGVGPLSSPRSREKYKKTVRERFGVEHPLQSPKVRDEMKVRHLEKHGVGHPSQRPSNRKKNSTRMRRLYEDPTYLERITSNNPRFTYYDVLLPDGSEIRLQGKLEPRVAQEIAGRQSVSISRTDKSFYYRFQGTTRNYLPDFMITGNHTTYVEVKSLYTMGVEIKSGRCVVKHQLSFRKNLNKMIGVVSAGHRMVLAIEIGKHIRYYSGPFERCALVEWITRQLPNE